MMLQRANNEQTTFAELIEMQMVNSDFTVQNAETIPPTKVSW